MAYLHCHKCGWQQDDFYSGSYNPAEYLLNWNEYLFGKHRDRLDLQFSDDAEFLRENGPITTREVLARGFEKFARRIRNMKWITNEDFINDPNKICPRCGSDQLDID